MSTVSSPSDAELDGFAPIPAAYLCVMTVTHGYRKGWNRLYSLPATLPMAGLDTILVHLFVPDRCDWDIPSVKLLSKVSVHGLDCESATEILPIYYTDEVTLASLDALSAPAEMHMVVEVRITIETDVMRAATWDLNFTADTTAVNKGKTVCLSGVNMAMTDENARVMTFDKAMETAILQTKLNEDTIGF
ncbi:hypothetical protein MMC34_000872 [Xylographa carneopallida]|nr:hypothetical protein [Xylographa carneopallida]